MPPERPEDVPAETPATHRVYRPGEADELSVERTGPGAFAVQGRRPERLIARHDVENEEAMRYVEERLRSLGVIRALEAAGFEPGDDVEIRGMVFELHPARRSGRSLPVSRSAAALTLAACTRLVPAAAAATRTTPSRWCASS